MHTLDQDQDQDQDPSDAATVLAARREVDPVLANLIVQPFDSVQVQALTRWLPSNPGRFKTSQT